MNAGAILGIGIDVVHLGRFARRLESVAFARRVFTPAEIAAAEGEAAPLVGQAIRFAAKEAVMKCLGAGIRQGLWFSQIEVLEGERTAPRLVLHRAARDLWRARGGGTWRLSLIRRGTHAHAFVILHAPILQPAEIDPAPGLVANGSSPDLPEAGEADVAVAGLGNPKFSVSAPGP